MHWMMTPRTVRLPVDDDTLAATLFAPADQDSSLTSPIVLCAHGLTGTRFGSCYRFVRLGRALARQGIACLTFDFRGCGESDGDFIDVTCDRLQADLRAVVEWVGRQEAFDASRMGLCGSSFGAFTTARVASEIVGLRALAFWAPVARPRLLFDKFMTDDAWKLLSTQGWLAHRGMPLGRGFFEIGPADGDGPAALAPCRAPLLIYHAVDDPEVPIEHARLYVESQDEINAPVQLVEMDAPDHGMRGVDANETILDGTAEWFAQHLLSAVDKE